MNTMARFKSMALLFLAVAVALLAVTGLLACRSHPERPKAIRLGLLVHAGTDTPETPDTTVRTAHLALESTATPGTIVLGETKHPLELLVEESDGTPEGAARSVLRLINQHRVTALIGFNFSRSAVPASRAAEKAGVPIVFPMPTHPDVTAGKRYAFRVIFTDEVQARAMARFARDDLDVATAATYVDVAEVYGPGMAAVFGETFERAGGTILAQETYMTGDGDHRPQLTRLRELAPEVLFLPSYSDEAVNIVGQARELGLGSVVLGTDGWLPEHLVNVPLLDGAYCAQPWHLEFAHESSAARRFVDVYRRAFGIDPDRTAAFVYDAVGLLLDALRRAGAPEPEAIRQALARTEDYPGATGSITFRDRGGDPRRKAVAVIRFEGGKGRLVRVMTLPEPVSAVADPKSASGLEG